MANVDRPGGHEGNPLMGLASAVLSRATGFYRRFAGLIGVLVLAGYVVLTAASIHLQPDANWDLLPYVAAAIEGSQPDMQAVHDRAYEFVRLSVGDGAYAALAHGDEFREAMSSNAGNFVSLLGMYRVKFLYVKTIGALTGLLDPVAAIRFISVVSTIGFGWVTFLWLRRAGALALGPLVAGVMIMAGFGDTARVGTPDMFCAALLLGGVYAYVSKREAASALLLFLAFLARPDNVIFLVLLAALVFVTRLKAPGALAAFAASFVAYFAVSHWAGHPGWWPHLVFSTLYQAHDMAAFHPEFSAGDYLRAFGKAALFSLEFNNWVGIVLLTLGAWLATHLAGYRMDTRAGVMFAALSLSLAAKFVVFPIHDTRVYFPALMPLLLLTVTPLKAFGQGAWHYKQKDTGGLT